MRYLLFIIFMTLALSSYSQNQESKYSVGFDFLPLVEKSSQPIETIFLRKNQGNYNLRAKLGFYLTDITFKAYNNEESDDEEFLSGIYLTFGFDKVIKKTAKTNLYYGAEFVGYYTSNKILGRSQSDGIESILDRKDRSFQVGINSLIGFEFLVYEKLSILIESNAFVGYRNRLFKEEVTIDGEVVSFIDDSIPTFNLRVNPISSIILIYKL